MFPGRGLLGESERGLRTMATSANRKFPSFVVVRRSIRDDKGTKPLNSSPFGPIPLISRACLLGDSCIHAANSLRRDRISYTTCPSKGTHFLFDAESHHLREKTSPEPAIHGLGMVSESKVPLRRIERRKSPRGGPLPPPSFDGIDPMHIQVMMNREFVQEKMPTRR